MCSITAGDWVKVTETSGYDSYGRVFDTSTSSDRHAIVGVQFACDISEISDARSVQGFTKEHSWIKELSKNPQLRFLTAWADIRYQSEITKLDSHLPFVLKQDHLYDQTSDILHVRDNANKRKRCNSTSMRVQNLIYGPSDRYSGRYMFPVCYIRRGHERNWQLRDPDVIEGMDESRSLPMPATTGSSRKRRRRQRSVGPVSSKRARCNFTDNPVDYERPKMAKLVYNSEPDGNADMNCQSFNRSMPEVPVVGRLRNSAILRHDSAHPATTDPDDDEVGMHDPPDCKALAACRSVRQDSTPMSNKDLAAAVASTGATDIPKKFLECAGSKHENGVEDMNVEAISAEQLLECRRALQKILLNKKKPPEADRMPAVDKILRRLEKQPQLNPSILRPSKIRKLLQHVINLPAIPREHEFSFRNRAEDLLSRWRQIPLSKRAHV